MNRLHKHTLSLVANLLVLVGLLWLGSRPVLAHSRTEVGPYVIVIGWQKEPVIVGDRNAILIEVTQDGAPVTGVESDLDLTVLYAGRSFRSNLNPAATPGVYLAEILPTVRGQYEVQLTGSIGDTTVDEVLEPEEVLASKALTFPDDPPDPFALQETVDGLSAQLRTFQILAAAGLVLGLAGLGVAVFALVRGRQP